MKNIFIYMPLFFGLKISNIFLLLHVTIAFIIFSIIASSVYIFNDIYDIEEDIKHPIKKNRPLASGKISKTEAYVLVFILSISGLSISFIFNINMFFLLLLYIILNVLYTIKLKHIPIVDVFIISFGFIIRIFIGGYVSDIFLSSWIIIMTFLLALFLALAKRRDDLLIYLNGGEKTRKNIDGYNLQALDASMIIMAAVTIVSYIMYTFSPNVTQNFHTDKLFYTVIFVIMGIIRYFHLTFALGKSGSPTAIILTDRFIQIVVLCWAVANLILIYLL